MLVKIITEDGLDGWGEAYGPPGATSAIVNEVLGPLLIGKDPFDNEVLWEEMYQHTRGYGQSGVVITAISAIDIALWDIKGKATNLPISKLLGGVFRNQVMAYATGMYFSKRESMKECLVNEAMSYVSEGFKAVKMKIGLSPDVDLEHVAAVRKGIGPNVILMVDANGAYAPFTAVRVGQELEKMGVYWFEEPVPPSDIEGYVEVSRTLDMAVAGGEGHFSRFGNKELIAKRAVDIIQPDVIITGGITECKKIADAANMWGIFCNPHCWGSIVALAATLQFLASLSHCPHGIAPLEPMLEFDRTENPFRDKIGEPVIYQTKGFVDIPSGPGLGITIKEDKLAEYVY